MAKVYSLKTAPLEEPVSLEEFKAFARIFHDEEDSTLELILTGARRLAERYTRRALITQTWQLFMDEWPGVAFELPMGSPLQSIVAVKTYDADGNPTTTDSSLYYIDKVGIPGMIFFTNYPESPGRTRRGIEIEYKSGHGDTPADVPQDLRDAVLSVAVSMEDRRQFTLAPEDKEALGPFRVTRLT